MRLVRTYHSQMSVTHGCEMAAAVTMPGVVTSQRSKSLHACFASRYHRRKMTMMKLKAETIT